LSAGYYDAYYSKAQKVRTLIGRDFEQAFGEVDVILSPTSPTPAFKSGARSADPLSMYMADVYTLPASLAGVPALSLPCAAVTRDGVQLPIGLQIMCPALAEERMFTAAAFVERLVQTQ
ncbi:MAG TPA: amidase family protein, partial [Polyangiaceae bacterium]|nr:amidase family protein [Polyangiaceae bacterium]